MCSVNCSSGTEAIICSWQLLVAPGNSWQAARGSSWQLLGARRGAPDIQNLIAGVWQLGSGVQDLTARIWCPGPGMNGRMNGCITA